MAKVEKRRRDRSGYVYKQLVADYDGQRFPQERDFYRATFMNLSRTGAAFLSARKPATDKVVIVLGMSQIYVVARIVRMFYRTDLWDPCFEIGCEFVRKLRQVD